MKINLSPERNDAQLSVSVNGDILTVNGSPFDFSGLAEGSTIMAPDVPCEWLRGEITRQSGRIELTLRFPHGPNPRQPVAFPTSIIDPPAGIVALPFEEVTNVDG